MLRKLTVSNLAVVERAEAVFSSGLNVITGETGAGKSVIRGALELALGGRAEASVVREGAGEAEVEAEFDGFSVRRTVTATGRSRAWVDDESVSLSELKARCEGAVEVHGPSANQKLLDESFQRAALDAFAGRNVAAAMGEYSSAWNRYAALRDEHAALSAADCSEDRLDLLRYQVDELEAAALSEEDGSIAERHAAAAHREEIVEGANAITEGLGGDRGVADMLVALQPKFNQVARHFPAAAEWAARAEALTLEIEELSRAVADEVSRIDGEDEDLAALDARLTLVNRLKRKYLKGTAEGDDVSRLMAIAASKRSELDAFENRAERLEELSRRLAVALTEVKELGASLLKARRSAAEKMSAAIVGVLRSLGFVQAGFSVEVAPAEPSAHGCDSVCYMFAPNPGESVRPLAAIASSGEIARVMLALKVVVGHDKTTLVFDEIDANIGGETARRVGERLSEVAKGRQVIAITHLPQSAAFGERHLVVAKRVSGGRTRTEIVEATGEERVREIARMLGGENLTSVVMRHAKELLELKNDGVGK